MSSKTRSDRTHDRTLEESFPASDPAANTGIAGSSSRTDPQISTTSRNNPQEPPHPTVMGPKRRTIGRTNASLRRSRNLARGPLRLPHWSSPLPHLGSAVWSGDVVTRYQSVFAFPHWTAARLNCRCFRVLSAAYDGQNQKEAGFISLTGE